MLLAGLIAWLTPFVAAAPALNVRDMVSAPSHEATILFGGDMMFDRSIRTTTEEKGGDFLFSCIDTTLRDADLVVANLEGPITNHESKSVGSEVGGDGNYTFTFPTSTAELLKRHNIALVNLGNNHMLNFSREGLVQTKKWLDEAGVAYFGDSDLLEADKVARPTINGLLFSFVNWSDWTPVGKPAASYGAGIDNSVVQQIRKEKESGRIVVVYAHWGDEYAPPTKPMRQLAHSFIDAGAAIVIGSHPHIVQEHEIYKGKNIYYSLGNFIFDQYFSEEVRSGLLLRIIFDEHGIASIEEIPIYLEQDRRTCPNEVE